MRGGKRLGAGRKKAQYKTTTIAFRVKTDYVEIIKEVVKSKIDELENLPP